MPTGLEMPTVLEALREELPAATIDYSLGCAVDGADDSAVAAAVDAARGADVAVVVVGDRAGLFGRGTVGEGNDVESLELPGIQRHLVESIVASGTPVVMVVLSGRPYAIAWAVDGPNAPAAVLQSFFPGEEGGRAIAAVLSGAVAPTGHLPVSLPRSAGAQPFTYLHPILGGPSEVTSVDTAPVLPFGHGLTYTTFERSALDADATVVAGDVFSASVRVRNSGERAGTDLVQLYARDVHASVTRPVAQLLGYHRVALEPGEEAVVRFRVPTARLSFTGLRHERIVEPGLVELWVGPSCAEKEATADIQVTGSVHRVTVADGRVVDSHTERVTVPVRGAEPVRV